MRVQRLHSVTLPRSSVDLDRGTGYSPSIGSGTGSEYRMAFFATVESRKNAAFGINGVLLVSSLILIGTGSSLMGFYRIHMLEVITLDFIIVPTVLTGGGLFTLLVSFFGFAAVAKEDSCLLTCFSVLLGVDFCILVAGIISSVRLLFDIQIGFLDADVMTELSAYETNSWVRYKWDTMQTEFTCCGGYGYAQGYMDWKKTTMGGSRNSVPDSCCLFVSPGCGSNLFEVNDIRVVIGKINVHGCITVMQRRMETHVTVILMLFSVRTFTK
ncbi:CD63 antigen [Eurytemora carolleeae]|uniref:CD63 antigen n=1 Tax=Eurytemora carolleeae TaxID=1294199 RepID=UPI000C7921F7|nr:CD63 antigen [Eurytemora carolleeae]|eukprot:XP_023344482.1 CD63 antigen-like [Eurytemora affinis]